MSLEPSALLRAMFGAPGHVWSAGILAAFAGMEMAGPAIERGGRLILSRDGTAARLAPRLPPGVRLLAFETLSSDARGWNHGVALCLPDEGGALPAGRLSAVEDDDPLDPAESGRAMLDLGIARGHVRALFAPDDLATMAFAGRLWQESAPALARLPGRWIIDTPFLRIEREGRGTIGLHSVPSAIGAGPTHAATTPVPAGMVPVAHVFPPHPARLRPGVAAAFDPEAHVRFQAILARHGRSDLWALKCSVLAALREGGSPPPRIDRHGQAVVRVALRQHCHLAGPPPRGWLERFDRPLLRALEAEGGVV